MVKKVNTSHTLCTPITLLDYGFRSVKRVAEPSSVESVGSNDVSVHCCFKRPTEMPRGERGDNVRWSRENEAQFIILLHHEYLNGQLQTSCFSMARLRAICDRLNALVIDRTFYNVVQCKTKWKRIKRAWRLLYDLRTRRGSGLGWDEERSTVVGPEDVLLNIYMEHRDNRSIIKHGLPHFDLCTEMFSRNVATGSHARSSMQPPPDSDDDDEDGDDDPPPPPSDDPMGPTISHSVRNFAPDVSTQDVASSSRSSGRKRSVGASERDTVLIRTMENFDGWITDKRAKSGEAAKSELQQCMDTVRAMEGIPRRLMVRASERLTNYATRQMFLKFDEAEIREWVVGLAD